MALQKFLTLRFILQTACGLLWAVCCSRLGLLARILKIPVRKSNLIFSARPDLAIQLRQILIPTSFDSLLCNKKGNLHMPCPRRWLVKKKTFPLPPKRVLEIENNWRICMEIFAFLKRCFPGNCPSKGQTKRVLAKSLVSAQQYLGLSVSQVNLSW